MDIAVKTEASSEKGKILEAKTSKAQHLIDSNTSKVAKTCEVGENGRRKTWQTYNATHNTDSPTKTNARNQEQIDLPQLHYYNKVPKRTSPTRYHHKVVSNLEGTRCGEIFVTQNARKWTFACTFCNKYTRDIGAFILHLKKKHLNGISDDTGSEGGYSLDDEEQVHERVCPTGGLQDQDYVDCSNYLDVNVHTVPEELNYNKNGENFDRDSQPKQVSKKGSPDYPNEKKNLRSNHGKTHVEPSVTTKNEVNFSKTKQWQSKSGTNGDAVSQVSAEGNEVDGNSSIMDLADCEQDSTCQDEAGWPNFKQEDDYLGASTAAGDVDDDFDNQLLFVPPPINDSLFTDNSSMDVASVRTVRRQIRGTAYCALCNKTFQYYSLYRNHMTKHSNETPFKCVLCKKGFKSKQAIRYHMHTHEKEKRHKCPLCHAAYYTESQVITHLLTHENSSIFPCMVCGKILRSDAERDHHLTTHTEERPFRCEYCNKLFRLRHHLSNHLKIHRQYRCDFCKSAFTSAVHQRKPYACVVCGKHPHVQRQVEQAQKAPPSTPTQSGSGSTGKHEQNEVNPLKRFDVLEQPKECVDLAEMVSETSSTNNSRSNSSSNSDSSGEDDNIGSSDNEGEDRKYFGSTENCWSNGLRNALSNEKQRLSCTYCQRTYSNVSALNYHIRNKHL